MQELNQIPQCFSLNAGLRMQNATQTTLHSTVGFKTANVSVFLLKIFWRVFLLQLPANSATIPPLKLRLYTSRILAEPRARNTIHDLLTARSCNHLLLEIAKPKRTLVNRPGSLNIQYGLPARP